MDQNNNEPTRIEYEYPHFSYVAFSNLLDFLLCTLLCLMIFIGTKTIAENTNSYTKTNEDFDTLKVESNLYLLSEDKSRIQDIVTFYNASSNYSQSEMESDLSSRIDGFILFMESNASQSDYLVIKATYDDFRVSDSLTYNGLSYFVINDGVISKNSAAEIPSKEYVENVYKYYIDNYALGQFVSKCEEALNYQKYFSNCLFFIEIPIAFISSIIIYFYIIPLCLSRGKKTIGKLVFHIATLNSKFLSPKFWQFTLNFVIFFLLECCLSVVSFLIPFIISFSMAAFGKKKQNFHNYLTNFYLVDCSTLKIYKSKDEIVKDDLIVHTPIDFTLNKRE
jgi:RDD family.